MTASKTKSFISHAIVKPVVAGVAAGAMDHFVMGNPDLKRCGQIGRAHV